MASQSTFIDDRDPRMVYHGDWTQQEGNSLEFSNTTTRTNASQASVDITFNGTGISIFGTTTNAPSSTPQTSYKLDDLPIQFINETVLAHVHYQQKFFQFSALQPGSHSLVITNLVEGSNLWLDFAEVDPGSSATPVQSPPPTILPASSPPGATNTVTVTTSGANAVLPTLPPSSPSSTPSFSTILSINVSSSILIQTTVSTLMVPGATINSISSSPPTTSVNEPQTSKNQVVIRSVAGSLGGLLFTALLVIGWLFFRKRRTASRPDQVFSYIEPYRMSIEPQDSLGSGKPGLLAGKMDLISPGFPTKETAISPQSEVGETTVWVRPGTPHDHMLNEDLPVFEPGPPQYTG